MSFRRLPFEFSTSDPAERQSELMRRFGIPSEDKMLVENPNVDAFMHSSPRFQHRIPEYFDGESPVDGNDSKNVDSPRSQPKVRVIPIHIEGQDEPIKPSPSRVRNLSGGSTIPIIRNSHIDDHQRHRNSSGSFIPKVKTELPTNRQPSTETKVCNIPIVIEGQNEKVKPFRNVPIQKPVPNKTSDMGNSECVSKSATEPSLSKCQKSSEPNFKDSLKKIEDVAKELEPFEKGVNEFNGVQGDKQYRYLDEMLTRCMIKLDLIDTFGHDEVRQSRKAVIKKVQNAIDALEAKVQAQKNTEVKSEAAPEEKAHQEVEEKEVTDEVVNSEIGTQINSDALQDSTNIQVKSDSEIHEKESMEIDQSQNLDQSVNDTACDNQPTVQLDVDTDAHIDQSEGKLEEKPCENNIQPTIKCDMKDSMDTDLSPMGDDGRENLGTNKEQMDVDKPEKKDNSFNCDNLDAKPIVSECTDNLIQENPEVTVKMTDVEMTE